MYLRRIDGNYIRVEFLLELFWLLNFARMMLCVRVVQFEEAVSHLPDSSWLVSQQLEQAITTIKRNATLILDSKAQTELLKKVRKCKCKRNCNVYYSSRVTEWI